MSFAKIRPGGFGVGTALTSAEMSQLDTDHSNSFDCRSGQTQTVQSSPTFNTGTVTMAGTTTVSGALSASNVSQCQMSGTNKVTLTSRSLVRQMPSHGVPDNRSATTWQLDINLFASCWSQQNGNIIDGLVFPVSVPNGCTITAFTVYAKHYGTHVGYPCTSMPAASLRSVSTAGNVITHSGPITDSPAQGTYEGFHSFGASGLNVVVDNTVRRYSVKILGEGGSNYQNGYTPFLVEITFTTTSMDDAAS